MVYCDRHFPVLSGRRTATSLTARVVKLIATPLDEMTYRMWPTLEYLSKVNTILDQTLDELETMGRMYVDAC
jgi:hypothetical protein